MSIYSLKGVPVTGIVSLVKTVMLIIGDVTMELSVVATTVLCVVSLDVMLMLLGEVVAMRLSVVSLGVILIMLGEVVAMRLSVVSLEVMLMLTREVVSIILSVVSLGVKLMLLRFVSIILSVVSLGAMLMLLRVVSIMLSVLGVMLMLLGEVVTIKLSVVSLRVMLMLTSEVVTMRLSIVSLGVMLMLLRGVGSIMLSVLGVMLMLNRGVVTIMLSVVEGTELFGVVCVVIPELSNETVLCVGRVIVCELEWMEELLSTKVEETEVPTTAVIETELIGMNVEAGVEVALSVILKELETSAIGEEDADVVGVSKSTLAEPEKNDMVSKLLDDNTTLSMDVDVDNSVDFESLATVIDPDDRALWSEVISTEVRYSLVGDSLGTKVVDVVDVILVSMDKLPSRVEINEDWLGKPVDKAGVGLTIRLELALDTSLKLVHNTCEVNTALKLLEILLLN